MFKTKHKQKKLNFHKVTEINFGYVTLITKSHIKMYPQAISLPTVFS